MTGRANGLVRLGAWLRRGFMRDGFRVCVECREVLPEHLGGCSLAAKENIESLCDEDEEGA